MFELVTSQFQPSKNCSPESQNLLHFYSQEPAKNWDSFFLFFFFLVITDNSFKFHKVIDYRVKKFSLSRDIKWHWDSLFLLKIFKKNCWPKTILDSLHSSTWWWTGEKKVTAWNNLLNDYITKMALGLFGLVEVFQLFYTFWGYLGMSRDYGRRIFFKNT